MTKMSVYINRYSAMIRSVREVKYEYGSRFSGRQEGKSHL